MNNYINNEQKERRTRLIFGFVTPAVFIVGMVSGMLINDSKYDKYKDPGIQKIVEAYEIMQNQWYFGKDVENFDKVLIDKAINGMLDNGDPYTFYTASMEEQGLSTNREGFGFSHSLYGGYRYINEVYEGSPAYRAGLLAGDVLMGFYDNSVFVDFKTKGRDEGTKLLNEYKNDTVTFKVLRNTDQSDLTITRGVYAITGARVSKEVINNETILYFDINTFLDMNIVNIVKNGVNVAASEGEIARVVFDVRDNGGGYVNAATQLVGLFVPRGETIMSYMYVDGSKQVVRNTIGPLAASSKIKDYVIIQNESSASASETFAVAMRDLLDAEIVGTKSYGKGIIQGFHEFSVDSVMRYTIAESLSPKGYSIHGVGITPDTKIEIDSELFFTYYGDVEVLSREMKAIVLKQINYLLDTEFITYELALGEWQAHIGADADSELIRDVAQELQKQLWDKYLEINEVTYQTALGV